MNNKVLVKVIIPELNSSFDVFIPVNEVVWKIKRLVIKCVYDLLQMKLDMNDEYVLMNKDNCTIYNNNEVVINTDIRNGSEILLISR